MDSVSKGNEFETTFYKFLDEQLRRPDGFLGAYNSSACRIRKKVKYFDHERGALTEFDIVIEIIRPGAVKPQMYLVFECKNYKNKVPETAVTDFSDKLNRLFRHNCKGFMVVTAPLQSGAENLVMKRGLGLIRYDENGFEITVERKDRRYPSVGELRAQMSGCKPVSSAIKFAAYYNGALYQNLRSLISFIELETESRKKRQSIKNLREVPFVQINQIKACTNQLLKRIGYVSGLVDLEKVCEELSLDVVFDSEELRDEQGRKILGSISFDRRLIRIHPHVDPRMSRFTIAHEIGHFCLGHEQFLYSEHAVGEDLSIANCSATASAQNRLEYQANAFAAELLLPNAVFLRRVEELRFRLGIRDRGFGYIYIDNQACNLASYLEMLFALSDEFGVSKQAIEVKLKREGMLVDKREGDTMAHIGDVDITA